MLEQPSKFYEVMKQDVLEYCRTGAMDSDLARNLEQLVGRAVRRFKHNIPRNDPDDIEGQARFKVIQNLHQYRPSHSITTWVYNVVRNEILMSRRKWVGKRNARGEFKRSRRKKAGMYSLEEKEEYSKSSVAVTKVTPSYLAQQRIDGQISPIEYAAGVFTTPFIEDENTRRKYETAYGGHLLGMKLKDLACALQLSPGTVKPQVYRTRNKLAEHYVHDFDVIVHRVKKGKEELQKRILQIAGASRWPARITERQKAYDQAGLTHHEQDLLDYLIIFGHHLSEERKYFALQYCFSLDTKQIQESVEQIAKKLDPVLSN